jgi:hypothetical protein
LREVVKALADWKAADPFCAIMAKATEAAIGSLTKSLESIIFWTTRSLRVHRQPRKIRRVVDAPQPGYC